MLHGLLRATAILGGLVCVFGTAYSYMALRLYGGEQLATSVGRLFKCTIPLQSLLSYRCPATTCVQFLCTATGAKRYFRVLHVCYVQISATATTSNVLDCTGGGVSRTASNAGYMHLTGRCRFSDRQLHQHVGEDSLQVDDVLKSIDDRKSPLQHAAY